VNIRVETWLGYKIRFVEMAPSDWWAVAVDACGALLISNVSQALSRIDDENKSSITLNDGTEGSPVRAIISEFGLYELIFSSRKKEAKEFKRWVFDILKTLRKSSNLEGFQIFRLLDKEHQKEAMDCLKSGLTNPVRVDFIRANSITNKTVSTMYGYPKMLKKNEMSPDMLVPRQEILDETVNLMALSAKFNLDLSISKAVQGKYLN